MGWIMHGPDAKAVPCRLLSTIFRTVYYCVVNLAHYVCIVCSLVAQRTPVVHVRMSNLQTLDICQVWYRGIRTSVAAAA